MVAEIAATTNKLAMDIAWQKGGVLMVDNIRFMHGRTDIGGDPTKHKILTQFGYCSFAPDTFPELAKQFWRASD